MFRIQNDSLIESYSIDKAQRKEVFLGCESKLTEIRQQLDEQKEVIAENQKKTKNLDDAINNINALLKSFGMEGFEIQKVASGESDLEEVPFYRIVREEESKVDAVFSSLSEGEKTLITFLYFCEMCCGSTSELDIKTKSDRVIVIDDPISSLSFNSVFEVAALIQSIFLKKPYYGQVFILTHHLYFLHELFSHINTPELPKKYRLYRVEKSGSSSVIQIKKSEIKSNYDCYWHVLRQVKNDPYLKPVLLNSMRNILEHYFSFIHDKDKLYQAFDALHKEYSDPACKAFDRAVNRLSHSDMRNLIDMNDIDVDKYLMYFEKIFKFTDFHKHYQRMMHLEDAANDDEGEELSIDELMA